MKLTKFTMLVISATLFFSCNLEKTNESSTSIMDTVKVESTPMVGNDVDEHGCKPSAGYTFSTLKNECIRVFESGIRMNAKTKGVDTTTSAFVVFKSETEKNEAEIFMPNSDKTIILKGEGDKPRSWVNSEYKLVETNNIYSLQNSKSELLYQSEK